MVNEGDTLDVECSIKSVYPEVVTFELISGNSVLSDQSRSSSRVNNDGTFDEAAVFAVEMLREYSSHGNRKLKCRATLPRGSVAYAFSVDLNITVRGAYILQYNWHGFIEHMHFFRQE